MTQAFGCTVSEAWLELTDRNPSGLVQDVLEAGSFSRAYHDLKRDSEMKNEHKTPMHLMVEDFELEVMEAKMRARRGY